MPVVLEKHGNQQETSPGRAAMAQTIYKTVPPDVEQAFLEAVSAIPAGDPTSTADERVFELPQQAYDTLADAAKNLVSQQEALKQVVPGDSLSGGARIVGQKSVAYEDGNAVVYIRKPNNAFCIVYSATDRHHEYLIYEQEREKERVTSRVKGASGDTEKAYDGDASDLLALRNRHLQDRGAGNVIDQLVGVSEGDVQLSWRPGRPACTVKIRAYSMTVNTAGEAPRLIDCTWQMGHKPSGRTVTVRPR